VANIELVRQASPIARVQTTRPSKRRLTWRTIPELATELTKLSRQVDTIATARRPGQHPSFLRLLLTCAPMLPVLATPIGPAESSLQATRRPADQFRWVTQC
jgi:hypothetical protein